MSQSDKTTIQVSRELKDILDKLATKKGDTYEDIIRRLVDGKNPEEKSE